jgi:type II secretion system protein N
VTAQLRKKLLRIAGYAAFFAACFVISLLLTFPYDRLGAYVEDRLQQATGLRVGIKSVRPTITGGIYAENVTLGPSLRPNPRSRGKSATSPYVQMESATLRVGLLSYLFGGIDTSFSGEFTEGEAEGSFERDDDHVALVLDLDGVDLSAFPIVSEKVGLPFSGKLSGLVDFDIPTGEGESEGGAKGGAKGELRLKLADGVLGDGKARLSLSQMMGFGGSGSQSDDEGMVIQPIKLGLFDLSSKVADGELELPLVEAESPDARLTLEGTINLGQPLSKTRVDTYLTVKLNQRYIDQDEQTKMLVTLADTAGRSAKRSDGAFGFRISGSLARGLSFRPSKNYTSRSRTGRRSSSSRRRKRSSSRRPSPRSRSVDRDEEGLDGPSVAPRDEDEEASGPRRPPVRPPPPSVINKNLMGRNRPLVPVTDDVDEEEEEDEEIEESSSESAPDAEEGEESEAARDEESEE